MWLAELNIRGLTTARDVNTNHFYTKYSGWSQTAASINRGISSSNTLLLLSATSLTTRVIPQAGVTHIIRLIYIQNTAQGDEHDNLPSTESEPCGGEKKTAQKKFVRERAVLNQSVSTQTTDARRALCPTLDYDMDALKSAGRAIIRSPSIAKQSWAAGRHKSEYTLLFYTCPRRR